MKRLLVLLILLLPLSARAQTASLPFHPGTTISVAVTNSASAAAAVPIGTVPSWQLLLQNTGSNLAFCKFGGSTVSAAVTDFPIPAGVVEVITVDQDRKYISCITASSTTTVYVTGGVGN